MDKRQSIILQDVCTKHKALLDLMETKQSTICVNRIKSPYGTDWDHMKATISSI